MRIQYSIQVSLYVHQREQTLEVQKAEQSRQEAHDVIQDLRKQKMVSISFVLHYFNGILFQRRFLFVLMALKNVLMFSSPFFIFKTTVNLVNQNNDLFLHPSSLLVLYI